MFKRPTLTPSKTIHQSNPRAQLYLHYLSWPFSPAKPSFLRWTMPIVARWEIVFFFFNPSEGKCCILSLGDYGNTIKRGKNICGEKLHFLTSLYHLCYLSSYIYPSFPSFFLPFIPPLAFFALYAAAHRMNPKCSHGVFTKSSDFSHSRGEWRVVVVVCEDISKAAFSYRYRPSPTPPLLPLFPHSPPSSSSSLHATGFTGVVWDVRTENGGEKTIDRASIVSGEMLQCDNVKPCWQSRAAQIHAALWPALSCGKV